MANDRTSEVGDSRLWFTKDFPTLVGFNWWSNSCSLFFVIRYGKNCDFIGFIVWRQHERSDDKNVITSPKSGHFLSEWSCKPIWEQLNRHKKLPSTSFCADDITYEREYGVEFIVPKWLHVFLCWMMKSQIERTTLSFCWWFFWLNNGLKISLQIPYKWHEALEKKANSGGISVINFAINQDWNEYPNLNPLRRESFTIKEGPTMHLVFFVNFVIKNN